MSDNDGSFGLFIFGIFIGALIAGLFFWFHATGNGLISGGGEFYIDGAIYQCSVTHKLSESK